MKIRAQWHAAHKYETCKKKKTNLELKKKKQFEQLVIYRKIAGECIENNNLFGKNLIYHRKKKPQ